MAGKGNSTRAILIALAVNFSIFIAKTIAAFYTKSGSMMAEAVHSLADCGNQVLLLFGMRSAKKPPSPDFPLGYGKAIYFWSFLVALLLFSVGGGFSIYEGVHKLNAPEPLQYAWLALGVLGYGIVAESVSMWGCMREVNKARGRQSVWTWFRESRQSELIVIFGEDLAALLGLVLAFFAVLATWITGNPLWDALGTIGIGILLIVIAIFIAIEVHDLLIGQSVDPTTRARIEKFIQERPEVSKLLNLITLQMGDYIMVAVKARMDGDISGAHLVANINTVELALKKEFPDVRYCFFEPDEAD